MHSAAPGLSCRTWALWSVLRPVASLVVACEVLAAACEMVTCGTWELSPWPGREPGPPVWGACSRSYWGSPSNPCFLTSPLRKWMYAYVMTFVFFSSQCTHCVPMGPWPSERFLAFVPHLLPAPDFGWQRETEKEGDLSRKRVEAWRGGWHWGGKTWARVYSCLVTVQKLNSQRKGPLHPSSPERPGRPSSIGIWAEPRRTLVK